MVSCPTCHGDVPVGEAEDGDWLRCPHCDGGVKALRPRTVIAPPKPPPTPRPSRVFGRALGVFTGILLMIVGVCGIFGWVIADFVTDPSFSAHVSSEGRFTVEFPGDPYRANPMTWSHTGPTTFPAVIYERTMPNDTYVIAWLDLPEELLVAGADSILNEVCTGASQHNAMVTGELSREAITVCGHPGYDMVTTTRGSAGKGVFRVVLVRERLYLMIVCGGWIQPDSARARYFLDSLKVW